LDNIDKYLLADRIYDGGHRLLTPFRGNPKYWTPSQKEWNQAVSFHRVKGSKKLNIGNEILFIGINPSRGRSPFESTEPWLIKLFGLKLAYSKSLKIPTLPKSEFDFSKRLVNIYHHSEGMYSLVLSHLFSRKLFFTIEKFLDHANNLSGKTE
jgi:hypothetical protein